MKIRAISLHQPYATAMALKLKRNETRHWPTKHRGPIAIHAARRDTPKLRAEFAQIMAFSNQSRLAFHAASFETFDALPRGCYVAVGFLGACTPVEKISISILERAWGVYTPGRFAWCMLDVAALLQPIPATGRQRFWTWDMPDELLKDPAIKEALDGAPF